MPHCLDPAVGAVASLSFAWLFTSAAVHKLRAPREFRSVVEAYELLPASVALLTAPAILALEMAVAVSLMISGLNMASKGADVVALRLGAGLAGAALLAVYAAAIAVNLRRGRHDLDCGCGGFAHRKKITAHMVWRNGVLASALVFMTVMPWSSRPYSWIDGVTILGGVAASALLYVAFEGLAQLAQQPLFAARPSFLRRGLTS